MKSDRVSLRAARDVRDALAALVGEVDPNIVLPSEAPALWQTFDQIERLAAGAKTVLAGRVEESGEWERAGCRSAAEHLARQAGTNVGVARDSLATSKRLGELPATREALARGELSLPQATAVSDAAAADPDAERRLLGLASKTNLHELRDECRRTKAKADPDPEATQRRIHNERRANTFSDSEGAFNLRARGPVDRGALVKAELNRLVDQIFEQHRKAGTSEAREAYAFDALVRMAERSAGHHTTESKSKKRTNPRYLTLVHLSYEAIQRGAVAGDERCEIPGLGPISLTAAQRLLPESILKLVITKGQDVATVVHLGRGPTAAQKLALAWTQPKCNNEVCSGTFCQIDHRIEWHKTRHTVLDELDRLCTHCHDLKTHHNWALIDGTGRRSLVPPTHPRHPRRQ